MATILFVHGTGVRKEGYDLTFATIEKRIAGWPHTLAPCLWGDKYGATSPKLSLPEAKNYDCGEFPLWEILASDPLYELELLAPPQLIPQGSQIGREIWSRIHNYQKRHELAKILFNCGLEPYWHDAWTAIIFKNALAERALTDAIPEGVQAEDEANDAANAIARALTAALLLLAVENGTPAVPIAIRRSIFQQLVEDWECQSRGGLSDIWNAAKEKLGFVADLAGSSIARAHRTDFDKQVGDILVYQGRGSHIQGFILGEVAKHKTNGPVVFLAHSLGGIACLDVLVEAARKGKPIAAVSHLITLGSQAPYFWELGAMVSLDRNQLLPHPFPKWINFFDPNDLLSYRAEPVFGKDRVTDVQVPSGLPSLHAHAAYWNDEEHVWPKIKEFLG